MSFAEKSANSFSLTSPPPGFEVPKYSSVRFHSELSGEAVVAAEAAVTPPRAPSPLPPSARTSGKTAFARSPRRHLEIQCGGKAERANRVDQRVV